MDHALLGYAAQDRHNPIISRIFGDVLILFIKESLGSRVNNNFRKKLKNSEGTVATHLKRFENTRDVKGGSFGCWLVRKAIGSCNTT